MSACVCGSGAWCDACRGPRLVKGECMKDAPINLPTAIGWNCGCGHPNGINLANCAGCGRPPHHDRDWGPNSVSYIYPAAPSPAEPAAPVQPPSIVKVVHYGALPIIQIAGQKFRLQHWSAGGWETHHDEGTYRLLVDRIARAAPVQQEPAKCLCRVIAEDTDTGTVRREVSPECPLHNGQPLYTRPTPDLRAELEEAEDEIKRLENIIHEAQGAEEESHVQQKRAERAEAELAQYKELARIASLALKASKEEQDKRLAVEVQRDTLLGLITELRSYFDSIEASDGRAPYDEFTELRDKMDAALSANVKNFNRTNTGAPITKGET